MKSRIKALFLTVFVAAAHATAADPAMPDGFKAAFSDSTGLTWRQSGSVAAAMTNAVAALSAAMTAQGYRMKHDIFDTTSPEPDRHLFLWVKPDEELTVMLWDAGDGETGFAWGLSAPEKPKGIPRKTEENKKKEGSK